MVIPDLSKGRPRPDHESSKREYFRPAIVDDRLEAGCKLFILRGLRIPTQSKLVSM
jgi:hypothetical protein